MLINFKKKLQKCKEDAHDASIKYNHIKNYYKDQYPNSKKQEKFSQII